MALVLKDRVKVTTTTTGTGAFAIGGAQFGFQGFSAFANGDTTFYTVVDHATGAWETGVGTYSSTGPTLARTQVLDSSNAGGLVNFGVGPKDVFVSYPAGKVVSTEGNVTMAGDLTVPSLNGGQLAGMRNKIINGKMEIAQRGTSFVAPSNGTYTLDRWVQFNTTAAAYTLSQQSDVPTGNEFQSSLRVAVTTADTSIAASDLVAVRQWVEGFNARDLIGRTFTLSFWVRSSKTGVHCTSVKNTGGDRSFVIEYTISAANTWEQKTITVIGGLITAGTWNWTSGQGLAVDFALAAGSTYHTTANAWQTGNFVATANQVNCLDTVGNIFAITGVQLEVGEVATPFEHRNYGTELALCQRYAVLFSTEGASNGALAAGGANAGATGAYNFFFPVPMRATPTFVNLQPAGNYILTLGNGGSAGAATSFTLSNPSRVGAVLAVTNGGGLTVGQISGLLANGTSPTGLLFTSEL